MEASKFSTVRFPYTYAYDYLRVKLNRPDISRGEMAQIVKIILQDTDVDKEDVCVRLATLYCSEHRIFIKD